MNLKKKIGLFFTFSSLFFGVILHNWAEYVLHLASHQFGAVSKREKITPELIASRDGKQKEILELIQKVKKSGEEMYGLENSTSYETFVDLKRNILGWNLTVSPALELKAKEFGFPIVGKFGYLGFFNEKLKDSWKKNFIKEGMDVYENQIGAYSTLGYFKDPVFSTYLEFNPAQIVRMVLHEMAHEKLYFKNDSDFSESLASFIERPASNFYLYGNIDTPPDIIKQHEGARKEYREFQDILDETRQTLEELYASNKTDQIKLLEKKNIYAILYKKIQTAEFKYLSYVKEIPEQDLNNAFLVQTRRYTPSKKNGFSGLLTDCHDDFQCWFTELKKLEKCPKDVRKKFSTTDMKLIEALKNCN
jgi:predicted aminopeptidase